MSNFWGSLQSRILDKNIIDFKIPILLHLSESIFDDNIIMCCGTCRVAEKVDLFTWKTDDFLLTDTMRLRLRFHSPIEHYYLTSYQLYVSKKSDTLIQSSFKFVPYDSTTTFVKLKEVSIKRRISKMREPYFTIEPNDYTAENYNFFGIDNLLSIPHFITAGVL